MSGEENWSGYFYRDAKDDDRRGKKNPQVLGLDRYGRKAGAASRHGWQPICEATPCTRYLYFCPSPYC